ncbi:hypothetical protein QTO34_017145 [Cnephaeus nilssonii]|uniref:Protein kinase domain-containing protein n=1 Tax=Cnephaeus nilssonii TaxID=3371016 RepID=A0AA40I1F0_CNENI|nr:hypothetical protein QTO34_017145 [Eptesicus nilssonii]
MGHKAAVGIGAGVGPSSTLPPCPSCCAPGPVFRQPRLRRCSHALLVLALLSLLTAWSDWGRRQHRVQAGLAPSEQGKVEKPSGTSSGFGAGYGCKRGQRRQQVRVLGGTAACGNKEFTGQCWDLNRTAPSSTASVEGALVLDRPTPRPLLRCLCKRGRGTAFLHSCGHCCLSRATGTRDPGFSPSGRPQAPRTRAGFSQAGRSYRGPWVCGFARATAVSARDHGVGGLSLSWAAAWLGTMGVQLCPSHSRRRQGPRGMSLSAGSSPLHSPKITPHTSPAPRRRSHTPNPANYMVPSSASTPVNNPVSQTPSSGQLIQKETVGGTTYFYTDTAPAPLTGMRSFKNYHRTACRTEGQIIEVFPNYHIYPPTAPHVAYMQPKANAPSFFMADELRQELINRHLITMAQVDQADMPEVDSYHSLFPLEPLPPPNRIQKSSNFGYITSCYKAVNSKDDLPYCLRRIHGFRLVNTKCMVLVDMWKKIQHSNIVTLREVFTTKAFAEPSLVFAYDFHAGGETMMSRHFNDPNADAYFTKRKWGQHDGPLPRQHAGLLPESLIWAYIVQLSSALRTIHTAGLACRVMDPTKILITGKTRLRVNCVGVFDVLTFDNSQNNNPLALMAQYQQADLISLGKVVLALACNSLAGIQRENLQKAMELVTINYSSDLKNLILYLLTDQNRMRSVNDIMPMIGARFYTQLDAAQMRNDVIEEDLAKEPSDILNVATEVGEAPATAAALASREPSFWLSDAPPVGAH